MPVEISSYVILALKKVTPAIESRELLDNWVVARVGSLLSKLGLSDNESMFSVLDHDTEYWNRNYGKDVGDLVEDYYFVEGDVRFYDSSTWEGPEPSNDELLEDSFYKFFHDTHDSSKNIELDGDDVILIRSYIIAP